MSTVDRGGVGQGGTPARLRRLDPTPPIAQAVAHSPVPERSFVSHARLIAPGPPAPDTHQQVRSPAGAGAHGDHSVPFARVVSVRVDANGEGARPAMSSSTTRSAQAEWDCLSRVHDSNTAPHSESRTGGPRPWAALPGGFVGTGTRRASRRAHTPDRRGRMLAVRSPDRHQ